MCLHGWMKCRVVTCLLLTGLPARKRALLQLINPVGLVIQGGHRKLLWCSSISMVRLQGVVIVCQCPVQLLAPCAIVWLL